MDTLPWCRNSNWLALLRAVKAAPADDLPRLIIADWLDEQGEETAADLATFIREGIRVPTRMSSRATAIYERYCVAWSGSLAESHSSYVRAGGKVKFGWDGDEWNRIQLYFRRGFAERAFVILPQHFGWAASRIATAAPTARVFPKTMCWTKLLPNRRFAVDIPTELADLVGHLTSIEASALTKENWASIADAMTAYVDALRINTLK